jgi:hypothetical protein
MLTPYDWIYGITEITNVFLCIIAGLLAVGLFSKASQKKYLGAWKYLLVALILFAMEGIFGALKVLGIWSTPWLTHVIPSFILLFLIAALNKQINITRGCDE